MFLCETTKVTAGRVYRRADTHRTERAAWPEPRRYGHRAMLRRRTGRSPTATPDLWSVAQMPRERVEAEVRQLVSI